MATRTATPIVNQYQPESVSAPGETLAELLEHNGWTQAEFAERVGRTPKNINDILQGDAPITPELALIFERIFGTSAEFWNNRERHFRDYIARRDAAVELKSQTEWLKEVPYKEMIKRGWIAAGATATDSVEELLRYFSVGSVPAWRKMWCERQLADYRASNTWKSDAGALAAWIRRGDIEAREIQLPPFDKEHFRGALAEIRALTTEKPQVFQKETAQLCQKAGVALLFVPELPKSCVHGAARWLGGTKPVIQLSLRQKTDDHVWFSLFHEAGHILLHPRKESYLDGANERDEGDVKEKEADEFAARQLISLADWRAFIGAAAFDERAIQLFARKVGIAPGVVVGRLQRERRIAYNQCNSLKRSFIWDEAGRIAEKNAA